MLASRAAAVAVADNAGALKRVVVVAVVVVFVLVLEMGAEAAELARLDLGTRGGENLPPCQNDFLCSASDGGWLRKIIVVTGKDEGEKDEGSV